MKLKFIRVDDDNIDVKIVNSQGEKDFSYVEMIKRLYNNDTLEAPEFDGEFSQEEQESLITLAKQISEKVTSDSNIIV